MDTFIFRLISALHIVETMDNFNFLNYYIRKWWMCNILKYGECDLSCKNGECATLRNMVDAPLLLQKWRMRLILTKGGLAIEFLMG